jgi:hypothetical protein
LAATFEFYIQDDWWASCEADEWREPDPLDEWRIARDKQMLLEVRARAYDQLRHPWAYRLADGCRVRARIQMDRALTASLPAIAQLRQQCLADPFLARMVAA